MEKKKKYFWINTLKYKVEEDESLRKLKDRNFLLVNINY